MKDYIKYKLNKLIIKFLRLFKYTRSLEEQIAILEDNGLHNRLEPDEMEFIVNKYTKSLKIPRIKFFEDPEWMCKLANIKILMENERPLVVAARVEEVLHNQRCFLVQFMQEAREEINKLINRRKRQGKDTKILNIEI